MTQPKKKTKLSCSVCGHSPVLAQGMCCACYCFFKRLSNHPNIHKFINNFFKRMQRMEARQWSLGKRKAWRLIKGGKK